MLTTPHLEAGRSGCRQFAAAFGVIALSFLLLAAPVRADVTVTMAQFADPEVLDPAYDTAIYTRSIMMNIFDGLVWRQPDGEVVPALAESWEFIDDTTLKLNLRKGVTFHNGDPFTADDVIFTALRYTDKDDPKPLGPYLRGMFERFEKVDDHTLIMYLPAKNATVMGQFTRMPILPAKAFQAMSKTKFGNAPIGTGPFKFASWERNEQLVLEAYENHWRGRAAIDRYVIKPMPEDFSRFGALKAGDVDIIALLPPERIPSVEADPNLKVGKVSSARNVYFNFNTWIEPFKDIRVRKALNHAVNVPEIIETVMGGLAFRNSSFCGAQLFGHNPNIAHFAYDPEKAKQLLAEAGYPNGFKTKMLGATGNSMKDREVQEAVVAQLAKVGVEVEHVNPEWADFLDQYYGRDKHGTSRQEDRFQGLVMFGIGGPTLDCNRTMIYRAWSEGKGLYWNTPQTDALIAKQMGTMDKKERGKLLWEIQERISEFVPYLYLFDQVEIYGLNKRIVWDPRPDEFIWAYDIRVSND